MQRPGKKIATNTFSGGMKLDRTVYAQDARTYRESYNGDIIYTGSGDAQFTNEKGNSVITGFPEDYVCVGGRELIDFDIVFLLNQATGFSEIGIFKLSPTGATEYYTTIFNDEFDPNEDKLNFSLNDLIRQIEFSNESENILRVYWNRKNDVPRVINIKTGLQSVSEEFVDGDYTPLASTDKYPWFYSVHSFALQNRVTHPIIKLAETAIEGNLKTGCYEMFAWHLGRDGYRTPATPVTRHFLHTLDPETIGTMHDRSMFASNVMTETGMRFQIKGIDTRFYKLEVGYIYSVDKDSTVEASIFYSEVIDPDVSDVTVDFRNTSGIPVSLSEFNRYIVPIYRVETMGQKDGRLWLGGIETYGPFTLDLEGTTITPFMREMLADDTTEPNAVPLTNVGQHDYTLTIESYKDSLNVPVNESYEITNDFRNYKGIQFEHLFSSYWGGETYPFALLVFNCVGSPFYAQPIRDYTFPNRFDDATYWLMDNGDFKNINLMGVKFGGIDLAPILFDKDDQLQVGGVAIVRCKRKPRVLCQGVLLPAVIEMDNTENSTEPLPWASNYFDPDNLLPGTPDARQYEFDSAGDDIALRPYLGMFYSPDLLFERNIFEGTQQEDVVEDVDQLEIIGLYDSPYDVIELNGEYNKVYTKNYEQANNQEQSIPFGAKSRLKKLIDVATFNEQETEWHSYDKDDIDLFFKNDGNIQSVDVDAECPNDNLHSQGVFHAWLVKTKDFKFLSYFEDGADESRYRYYIANYSVNQEQYYTAVDQSSLEQRTYIGTGHFLPITEELLDAIQLGETYTLNDMEVWGGDCYPWVFDFVRLLPKQGTCEHDGDCWADYGVGMVVPLESSMNVAMRRGRNFAGSGIRSQSEACGIEDPPLFSNGIMEPQPEEFYLNSVVMHEGNVQLFISKPSTVDPEITLFPYTWLYSLLKIPGELTDQYRVFVTSNRGDMDARYGKIIGRAYLFDSMYCLQERGFFKLMINERATATTLEGQPIQIGTPQVWQHPWPISVQYGCIHPFSIVSTGKAIYWCDYYNKAFMRFAQDGVLNLSEYGEIKQWSIDNLKYFSVEDTTIEDEQRHIAAGYDYVRDMIYWALTARSHGSGLVSTTVAFSENNHVNAFVGFKPFVPYYFFNAQTYLVTASDQDQAHVYYHGSGSRGRYYGVFYDTILKFIVNPMPDVEKRWDNSWANINPDGYTLLRLIHWTTEEQTQTLTLASATKSEYRNLIFRTGTVQPGATEHLSGKYLQVEMIFTNADDKVIMFTSHDQSYVPITKSR